MHLFIQQIHSNDSLDFSTQIHSIIDQSEFLFVNLKTKRRIVKITVFSRCNSNEDYQFKMKIMSDIFEQYEDFNAPFSFISQPPLTGGIIIEFWLLDYFESECTFSFSKSGQKSVLFIDSQEFKCLFSTQFSAKTNDFKQNVLNTFNLINTTLSEQGFDYSEIVRQWNYIENITTLDDSNKKHLQNYQLFNDLRSLYYEKTDFSNGFPSATGIGVANGGCTIEFVALKEKKSNSVKPITNSLQIDAPDYTSTVLIGLSIEEVSKKSSPKFERGKYMKFGNDRFLFISGTASIIGENTVFFNDVSKQTITTLQIIDHLISVKNLTKNKIKVISKPLPLNYRVYLKNESDYVVVKPLCEAYFGMILGVFIKADICRGDLLVEIEANYRV